MTIDKSAFPPIRTDVSVTLHPDLVANKWASLDDDGTPGQQALIAAIGAARAAYMGKAEAMDARKGLADYVEGKQVMTPKGAKIKSGFEREYGAGVQRIKDKVLPTVDAYAKQVAQLADQLTARVRDALKDRTTPPAIQQEIRAHVKGLPEQKRLTFVLGGSLQTYAAVAAGPAYLSGLTGEQMALAETKAEERFSPVESAQLKATCEIIGHLHNVRSLFLAWADGEIADADTPAARAVSKVKALGR